MPNKKPPGKLGSCHHRQLSCGAGGGGSGAGLPTASGAAGGAGGGSGGAGRKTASGAGGGGGGAGLPTASGAGGDGDGAGRKVIRRGRRLGKILRGERFRQYGSESFSLSNSTFTAAPPTAGRSSSEESFNEEVSDVYVYDVYESISSASGRAAALPTAVPLAGPALRLLEPAAAPPTAGALVLLLAGPVRLTVRVPCRLPLAKRSLLFLCFSWFLRSFFRFSFFCHPPTAGRSHHGHHGCVHSESMASKSI